MSDSKQVSVRRDQSNSRQLSARDFARFSEFIHTECGIKMPPSKKTMLEARLQKRLRALALPDYSHYCAYFFSKEGMATELPHLLDVVTTNTTDFFREPNHFDLLSRNVLPRWLSRHQGRELAVWSAGCSTGEEPYSLAIVLSEFQLQQPEFRFTILATDISTRVLEHASRAVYAEDKLEKVPKPLHKLHFLRSKDRSRRLVRVAPEVRRLVSFQRLNFMEEFSFKNRMDIIFCRNVMIYFDRPTQERLLSKFCSHLYQGGHIFIGHSESLTGMQLPLRQLAPTVYERV
ncbi:protein-glutamate O-methyltransferase [Desulfocurvibacter africanus]|uniref:CheR family methyltransferase n=1 Tax=Desulfocurvibacter africanus TaxID=873 RepID=UPI002FD92AF1